MFAAELVTSMLVTDVGDDYKNVLTSIGVIWNKPHSLFRKRNHCFFEADYAVKLSWTADKTSQRFNTLTKTCNKNHFSSIETRLDVIIGQWRHMWRLASQSIHRWFDVICKKVILEAKSIPNSNFKRSCIGSFRLLTQPPLQDIRILTE